MTPRELLREQEQEEREAQEECKQGKSEDGKQGKPTFDGQVFTDGEGCIYV